MNELTITKELSGLDKGKAKQIEAVFAPMVKMLKEFEAVFDEIEALEMSRETCIKAKRLRLDISKVRTDADKARKVHKEEYLRAGNAIQGVYNILKFAVADKEEKLKNIETHYERIEEEKAKRLQVEREAELLKYDVDGGALALGDMDDVVWNNFLSGTKGNHEAVIAAEKKAEGERIAAERKEAEEREKMRIENEQLKEEAAVATKAKAEADRIAAAEKQAQEAKIREEREAREKLEREIVDREVEAERIAKKEANRKAEAEWRTRVEADTRASAEKKAQLAPDKEKLYIIAADLLAKKETVVSDDAKDAIETAGNIILAIAERM